MVIPGNVTTASNGAGQGRQWRQRLAQAGEDAAMQYFVRQGATVLARNWRAGRYAEIDLIVELKGVTVFVEVKTRRKSPHYPQHTLSGFESINWRKQQKIVTSARIYFARQTRLEPVWRVDVVVVQYALPAAERNKPELPDPDIIHVADAICL